MDFRQTSPRSEDAGILLNELNQALTAIIGHDGTAHLNLEDFEQEKAFFLIGYEEDTPVCCAGLRRRNERTGEVRRVYARVNESGYGAALMAEIERQAAALGYTRLVLECRDRNVHALEFYRRAGYVPCESYPPYDREPDAVCMEKFI